MVLPQVSFEQPSSDSTEMPKKEEHWSGQRKVSADFSSDARIFTVSCLYKILKIRTN